MNLLIRTTIIALHQANVTGNYSVLRDLAAPGFQTANSQARLAEIFANLRGRNLDLTPILFFEPKLVRPPTIEPSGHLRLSGYFETTPEQVSFDMSFERTGSDWRLFGLAVEVAPPANQVPAPDKAQAGNSTDAPVHETPDASSKKTGGASAAKDADKKKKP